MSSQSPELSNGHFKMLGAFILGLSIIQTSFLAWRSPSRGQLEEITATMARENAYTRAVLTKQIDILNERIGVEIAQPLDSLSDRLHRFTGTPAAKPRNIALRWEIQRLQDLLNADSLDDPSTHGWHLRDRQKY